MKPLSSFHTSLGFLVLLNLLLKPIWIFIIDRNVQLHFGNELYGQYYALFNLSLLFVVLIDFGFTNYFISYQSKSTFEKQTQQLQVLLATKVMGALFYMLITFTSYFFLEFSQFLLLFILCSVQIANSYLLSFRAFLQVKQQFKVDSIFSVFDKTLSTFLIIIIFITPYLLQQFSLTQFAIIQLSSLIMVCICLYYLLIKSYHQSTFFSWHFDAIKTVVKKSIPFALVIISMSILMRIDVLLLKWLRGNSETGIYVYGFRFFDTFNNVGYLVAGYLFPFFCFHIHNKSLIQKTVRQYSFYGSIAILIGFIILFFMRTHIAAFLYKNDSTTVITLILFCSIAFLGIWWVHIYSSLLTASKNLKSLFYCTILFIGISFFLNWVFIPLYGALASATILACVQLFYGFSLYLLCLHKKLI